MVHFDPLTHRFKPVLPGLAVEEAVYSPDRQWILYSIGNQLWRSRPDGSDRRRLVEDPAIPNIHGVRWSPDSKHVLFENTDGGLKGAIYLVSADGGRPQLLLAPDASAFWPDLLHDGKTLLFTSKQGVGPTSKQGLYLFDLDQRQPTMIPGSGGLISGRWSPDGRFIAAVSLDQSAIQLLDLGTHRWTEIARGAAISTPLWSADSVLYFQDILAPGEPVYRFRPGNAEVQRAYSFEDILLSGVMRCAFGGLLRTDPCSSRSTAAAETSTPSPSIFPDDPSSVCELASLRSLQRPPSTTRPAIPIAVARTIRHDHSLPFPRAPRFLLLPKCDRTDPPLFATLSN